MNSDYKLISIDIDDTLINSSRIMTEKTKEALIKMQENGITVVLCSGRPTMGMEPLAKSLKLDEFGGYIISYNGANILEAKSKKLIYENNVSVAQIQKVYDLSVEHGVGIHTYTDTHIIAEKFYKYTQKECEITSMPFALIDSFKEEVNKPVVKAIMVGEPEELKKIQKSVKSKTEGLYTTFSKPYFFEFMNNGVDKGLSLKYLCEKLGIKSSEVMAFGDSHNDLPMIEYAGMGIAMGNAVNEAKEIANFVTKTNDEDGIVYALEKFL